MVDGRMAVIAERQVTESQARVRHEIGSIRSFALHDTGRSLNL
jgi:hypothetical protein